LLLTFHLYIDEVEYQWDSITGGSCRHAKQRISYNIDSRMGRTPFYQLHNFQSQGGPYNHGLTEYKSKFPAKPANADLRHRKELALFVALKLSSSDPDKACMYRYIHMPSKLAQMLMHPTSIPEHRLSKFLRGCPQFF
jgi:hypothetical protein